MGARIYLGKDFGMRVEFLTSCHKYFWRRPRPRSRHACRVLDTIHDLFSGVGLGRDFGIWQNLNLTPKVDPLSYCKPVADLGLQRAASARCGGAACVL